MLNMTGRLFCSQMLQHLPDRRNWKHLVPYFVKQSTGNLLRSGRSGVQPSATASRQGRVTGNGPVHVPRLRWPRDGRGLAHWGWHTAVTTWPRVTVEGGSSAGTSLAHCCRAQHQAAGGYRTLLAAELLVPAGPCQLNLMKMAQHSKWFSPCTSVTFSPCQVASYSVLMESAGGWAGAALLPVGVLALLEGSSRPSLCMEPRFLCAAARRWHLSDKIEEVNGLSYNFPHKI